ncbi:MAG: winged helix-turn-helix transcriptional regulator [Candidatus Woesearchaeota archaeon]
MKQWVVALLLVPMVFATNVINTSETRIDLEGSTAVVHSNILLMSDSIGNLTLILSPNPYDVEIFINGARVDCLIQAEFARCGSLPAGAYNVNVTYETSYPIATVGENTLFRYTDKLPYPALSQEVTLALPVGYIIPRERGKDESFYISPKPAEVYSDGQRIILSWMQAGQELSVSVIARRVVGPPVGWIAATGVLVLLTAVGFAWFVLSQKKVKAVKQKQKKKVIVPSLIDKEQQVVDFLKQNGEVWQKQIQQATGFSKAKVSRILRNLEERGVVQKTIYGNTNKISLKK